MDDSRKGIELNYRSRRQAVPETENQTGMDRTGVRRLMKLEFDPQADAVYLEIMNLKPLTTETQRKPKHFL
jgi:hypothetical protein